MHNEFINHAFAESQEVLARFVADPNKMAAVKRARSIINRLLRSGDKVTRVSTNL